MAGSWTAVWDAPRPFVHPLRTPSGAVLTVEAPDDHPWHHGLWSTIKLVNGENFWEEYGEFGLLHTTSVRQQGTQVTASIDWIRPDGVTVAVRETRTIAEAAVELAGTDGYALDWQVELLPMVDTTFDRTPFTTWGGYSGLTLRGAPDWHDSVVMLPDGRPRDRVLGEPAPWCALHGTARTATGDETRAGVAIFDHPGNPNHPTPWYASTRADTYGEGWANFANAAFLWDGPLTRRAGETLSLRHRVLVHDGEPTAAGIARAYDDWVTQTRLERSEP